VKVATVLTLFLVLLLLQVAVAALTEAITITLEQMVALVVVVFQQVRQALECLVREMQEAMAFLPTRKTLVEVGALAL
jgi:hypothetical protein